MTSFNDDDILIETNRNKYQFDEASAQKPLMMELVFYVEKYRYCYGFTNNDVHFGRTNDKKEVDFVLSNTEPPLAYEIKKSNNAAKASKYNTLPNAYPEF